MPILQRYSNIKNGGIVFIGNTLGLSKMADANRAGTLGSIGAFISLDGSLKVNDFPAGTTLDYTRNGSEAALNLPAGSTVLYAELVWGGLFRSSTNDISALLDNAVEFRTPLGTYPVSPDAGTKQNFNITNDGLTVGFYVRSANVTARVKSAQNGTYSAGKIPALIEAIDARTAQTNHAGWTLAVVYENESLPLRNLTMWGGGTVVSPAAGNTDVTLTGFLTPAGQALTGKLFVSAQEGDAVIPGDRLLFGKTVQALFPLSGPNNPVGNFFGSQINGENGLIDTSGTFGTRNANAFTGTNTSACRQGWDITAVDISPLLTAGMTAAAVRFTTSGDLYVTNYLALQIDSKGARLQVQKSADRTFAEVGEEIVYSVRITNTGNLRADTVSLEDFIPAEAEVVPGSVFVNGIPYGGGFPVSIGALDAGAEASVRFSMKLNSLPASNPVFNIARADYTFSPFPGYPVSSFSDSDLVAVYIVSIRLSVKKAVDKAYAAQGEELTYTSSVRNDGNLPLKNIVFTDGIPAGTAFVAGSVTVDGTPRPFADPAEGIPLPDLVPAQSATVVFRVKIS